MRKTATIAAAAVTLVLVGGVAVASIPDSSGVIHGCRKTSDGSVRVIDTAVTTTCPTGYVTLNWSQTGPAGPTGAAGVSGYQVVQNSATYPTGLVVDNLTIVAQCPAGEKPTGGGARLDPQTNSTAPAWIVTASQPYADSGDYTHPTGWLGVFAPVPSDRFNALQAPLTLYAWAVCATVN